MCDKLTYAQSRTTYTCGEDGFVRAWRMQADESTGNDSIGLDNKSKHKEKRKDKKERRKGDDDSKKGRFAPY